MTVKAVADEQIGQFARRMRDLQERVEKGVVPFDATMDGLQYLIEGKAVIPVEPPLLKLEKTIATPAITVKPAEIVARATVDRVKIWYTNAEFDQLRDSFGDQTLSVSAGTLRVHTLERNSLDEPILAALGGEKAAEIGIPEMLAAMRQMQKSKMDIWFVCYIRDTNGVIWAVSCFWFSVAGRWHVAAYPVTSPHRWYGGYRVVSR